MTRKVNRHLGGPGNTIPKGAAKLGWPEHILRGACARGEVETVLINGLHRIPDREIERLRCLFGPEPINEADVVLPLSEAEVTRLRTLLAPSPAGNSPTLTNAEIKQLRSLVQQSENAP